MSRHTDQVGSVLSRAIQTVLARGLQDPRVGGIISITEVRTSTDMANATVLVSIMPAEKADLAMHGLRHAARYIRREVGKQVRFRRMPVLTFKLDHSLKKEAQVINAINRACPAGEADAEPSDDDSRLEDSRT